MSQLRPHVTREGQSYVDDPVRVKPRRISILERSVAAAMGKPVKEPPTITIGTERVRLNWRKPK